MSGSLTLETTTPYRRAERRTLGRALGVASIAGAIGAGAGAAVGGENLALGAALGAGAMLILVGAAVALADWRQGFLLLVFLVLAEDSLRKAVPGAPGWVNLGKDFVLAACYLGYWFSPIRNVRRQPMSARVRGLVLVPVFIWAAFVALQAFNPSVPHPLVGISGIRTWMLYVPVFWLAAAFFTDSETAHRSLNRITALALPFLVLCLLQNNFAESLPVFLSEGVFKRERSLEGGGWIGYNESFFASPTLYALICLFQLCLAIGLLKTDQSRRWTIVLWLSGYAAVAGAYLSGVRTSLALMAIAILALTPLMLLRKRITPEGNVQRRRGLLLGGLAGLLLGTLLVVNMGDLRQRAFWTSFDRDYVSERVTNSVGETGSFDGGLLGNGTGSAGASGRVMTLLGQPSPSEERAEYGITVISYSFGDVGLGLGLVLSVWFLFGLLQFAIAQRNGRFAPLRYCLWIYLGAQMAWYIFKAFPVLENGTMCLLFWSAAGLIIGLGRLDQQEDSKLLQPGRAS